MVMSHPHGVQGPALVSESSLLSMTQCVLQFGIFLLHSHLHPCCASGPVLPSLLHVVLALMVVPNHPSLAPAPHPWLPGLCQCQGGEHEAPAHSKPPLHSCLLWGAEGQQIIIPCCSSLMCVLISYNYVAILVYLFIHFKIAAAEASKGAQPGFMPRLL